jgi:glycosyltransferase involved in cell wall biosynthesis
MQDSETMETDVVIPQKQGVMSGASKRPFVSVIMPVRNEARFMARSLRAVLAQDYPFDRMEVIVIDGMSTDRTRQILRYFQAQDVRVKLIDNPEKIVPTGLNLAIAHAQGDVIVRVDGHCEIAVDYIRQCVTHLENDEVDGVGGPLETIGDTPRASVIARAMSSSFGVGGSAFRTTHDKTMLTDTVAFPAYTRRIIERAGPFDEEMVRNQDDEFNYRLRKMGARILLAADVRCRYHSRNSFRSLWKQYFQYGYWKIRVIQKNPRQVRFRQFVPLIFVTALMISFLMIPLLGVTVPFALILASYLLAIVAASLREASRTDERPLTLLPLAYATLHLSYGFGFLVGLARFWNRWGDRKGGVGPIARKTTRENM